MFAMGLTYGTFSERGRVTPGVQLMILKKIFGSNGNKAPSFKFIFQV